MAGLSDVLNQLAAQAAAVIYPNGTAQPSACGMPVKIYPGWPVPNVLETDLAAGTVHVSVYPGNTERKTTRSIGQGWVQVAAPVHTVQMTVSGSQVTLSGTPGAQNLLITLNGTAYVYALQASDSLNSAATGLCALIPGATSNGAVITLTGVHSITVAVGGFGTAMRETKRQEKQFQVTVWAPTPLARDLAAEALDSALSATTSMSFTDGSAGIVRYSHTFQTDQLEKAGLYRRDLFYSIDYATTQTQASVEVIAPVLNTTDALTGLTESTLNP